jgi:hypothetical protein
MNEEKMAVNRGNEQRHSTAVGMKECKVVALARGAKR